MAGVTWGRAFKAAILFMLYSLAWVIIGGLFLAGAFFAAMEAYRPSYYGVQINWGAIGGAIILGIMGFVIMWLGTYASFFKVNTEIISEYVTSTPKVSRCPKCGAETLPNAKFCAKCGAVLE